MEFYREEFSYEETSELFLIRTSYPLLFALVLVKLEVGESEGNFTVYISQNIKDTNMVKRFSTLTAACFVAHVCLYWNKIGIFKKQGTN